MSVLTTLTLQIEFAPAWTGIVETAQLRTLADEPSAGPGSPSTQSSDLPVRTREGRRAVYPPGPRDAATCKLLTRSRW